LPGSTGWQPLRVSPSQVAQLLYSRCLPTLTACFGTTLWSVRPAWNSHPGRGLPQAPCLAQVCCGVSICCVIGCAATSVVSAHLEIRLEAKPVGAEPDEAVASCNPEKAQAGNVKACRPTPGTGIPRHGWSLPLVPSHFALTLSIAVSFVFFVFFGYAATQLARQVQQERTQVVCSNKAARKRLARRHSRNSCHMFVCIVVCACSRYTLDFKLLFLRSFCEMKGLMRDYFTYAVTSESKLLRD